MKQFAAIGCVSLLIGFGILPSHAEMRIARAMANSPGCPAQTCSAARAKCELRCGVWRSGTRGCGHCTTEFASCMRTGVFNGFVCQLSGLERR